MEFESELAFVANDLDRRIRRNPKAQRISINVGYQGVGHPLDIAERIVEAFNNCLVKYSVEHYGLDYASSTVMSYTFLRKEG